MKQLCICGFISWLWIFLGSTLHGQLLISKTTIDYICHFLKYNKKAKYMGFWAAAYILKVQTWYSNVVKRSCLARMSLNGFFRARFHRYSVWQTHLRDLSSFFSDFILFFSNSRDFFCTSKYAICVEVPLPVCKCRQNQGRRPESR